MRLLDRVLQRWRVARALPWIPAGSVVLDIGCADGALFRQAGARIARGLGIDATLRAVTPCGAATLVPGRFPDALQTRDRFDAITLLAVLEHVPAVEQPRFAASCARHVRPGGVLVATVPQPAVDHLLSVLRALRLVDGMSLEEHFGFDPRDVPRAFTAPDWTLVHHGRFQLGLNNLFVFRRTATDAAADGAAADGAAADGAAADGAAADVDAADRSSTPPGP